MKKLDIAITKAQLMSFEVTVDDGKPVVSVTLSLMTEGGKKITHYSIDNRDWRENPLEIPVSVLPLIGDLARALEGSAVRNCKDSQLALPAPKEKPKKAVLQNFGPDLDGKEVDLIDAPINLDDIPL